MTLSINVAGTWKDPTEVKVNVAGTWRTIDTIQINVAGTWKTVYSGATLSLAVIGDTVSNFNFNAPISSSVSLTSAGDINITDLVRSGDQGDWVTPTSAAGSAYECRMVVNSGSVDSGTTGTWLNLGTTRTWSQNANFSVSEANVTLEVGLAGLNTAIASITFTFRAESSAL